ncbi:MAG: hypothetical protein ACI4LM_07345 [Anaerovoracaceae bacterium]
MKNSNGKKRGLPAKGAAAVLLAVMMCIVFTGCSSVSKDYKNDFALAVGSSDTIRGITYYDSSLNEITQYKYVLPMSVTGPDAPAVIGNRMYIQSDDGVTVQNLLSGRMHYRTAGTGHSRRNVAIYLDSDDGGVLMTFDKDRHMMYEFITDDGEYEMRAVSLDSWKTVKKASYDGIEPVDLRASDGYITGAEEYSDDESTEYKVRILSEDDLNVVKTIKCSDYGSSCIAGGKVNIFMNDGKFISYDTKTKKTVRGRYMPSGSAEPTDTSSVSNGRYVFVYESSLDMSSSVNPVQPRVYVFDTKKMKTVSALSTGPTGRWSDISAVAVSGGTVYVANAIQKVKYEIASDSYDSVVEYNMISKYRFRDGKLTYETSRRVDGKNSRSKSLNNGPGEISWMTANA